MEFGGQLTELSIPGVRVTVNRTKHSNDGLKSIEEIQVGNFVVSKNEAAGETTWKPVVELFRNENKSVLNLSLVDGQGAVEVLGVTPEHPFWVDGKVFNSKSDGREQTFILFQNGCS